MKLFSRIIIITSIILLSSCAKKVNFPLSNIVPAAEITVTKKQDKNDNLTLEITAENLASADRLSPPKNNYSVWIVTENNGTKNIGQMIVKNGKKTSLKTTTPFNVKEIFITAEEQSDLTYPTGIEISRITLQK